jgi:cytoskeletal protein CcmA (bactofilin family)
MVFWRNEKKAPGETSPGDRQPAAVDETTLGPGWRIKGRVYGKGRVIFQCGLDGEVDIQGQVTVEPGAVIKGTIHSEDIRVRGRVEGNLECLRMATLEAGARFEGELISPRLHMAPGAVLNGAVAMEKNRTSLALKRN